MKLKALLLTTLLFSAPAFAAPGEPYSDEWIQGRISGAYAFNTALDSSDISVDVKGGDVTLKGSVPTMVEREFAEDVAKASDGVKTVTNKIEVDENLKMKTRSSFSQKVTDATVTAAVKSRLLSNRDTHGMAIKVDTKANAVTLSGNVESEKEKKTAEQLAYQTSGVRTVNNNITVSKTESASRARLGESKDMATAMNDGWISTKVRSLLMFTDDFPGSDVNVTTTNGVVTLEGYSRNAQQRSLIAQEVGEVAGVKSVDNRLAVNMK